VRVEGEGGWVTLSGVVDWYFQRKAAEEDVRRLKGVIGVTNDITIKPGVQAGDLRQQIKSALKRNASIEADEITIKTDGGKVTLSGKVRSWNEDSIVTDTAWSAPGVTDVEDRLVIA
jgi:osmotically-inducible protein OsmY